MSEPAKQSFPGAYRRAIRLLLRRAAVLAVTVVVCFRSVPSSAGKPQILRGHRSLISCVTFAPDSKRLASCAADNNVMIWDVATSKAIRTLTGHKDIVWSVAYSPDGKRIASTGWDDSLRIWDAETGELIREIVDKSGKLMGVVFAPDGKTIATVKRGGDVEIRDAATGDVVKAFDAQAATFPAVAFDATGKRLFATSSVTEIISWNLEPGEDQVPNYFTRVRNHACMAVSPLGDAFATPAPGWMIQVRDLKTLAVRRTLLGNSNTVRSLAFSRDGKLLASGSEDKSVRIWNIASEKQERVFTDHTGAVWSVACSPDGRWLASASEDMTIRIVLIDDIGE